MSLILESVRKAFENKQLESTTTQTLTVLEQIALNGTEEQKIQAVESGTRIESTMASRSPINRLDVAFKAIIRVIRSKGNFNDETFVQITDLIAKHTESIANLRVDPESYKSDDQDVQVLDAKTINLVANYLEQLKKVG